MRKIITWLIGSGIAGLATVALTTAPASAAPPPSASPNGSPAALSEHGWGCVDAIHAVHCAPPGIAAKIPNPPSTSLSDWPKTIPVRVFDTRDVQATDAPFLGTEHNTRLDQFHGQPCPTDPPSGEYTNLLGTPFPIPYWACHRFDSPLP